MILLTVLGVLGLTGLSLVLGFGELLLRWWKHRQRDTTAPTLPPDTVLLYRDSGARQLRTDLVGSFMLISIGTFGLNQLGRLLALLFQCGLEQLVGSILVIENDVQLRTQFTQRIPEVFHARLVYGFSSGFSGGMGNRPTKWVVGHIDTWGPAVRQATEELIDRQLRLNASRAPSDILLFSSLGGQGPLGLPLVERLHERFEETLIIGFTALPRHERLRERSEDLKPAYEQCGLHGWVLEDNLGRDPITTDYAMVALIVALSDAALQADQATRANNTFSLALTRQPGAVLVYEVVTSSVVGYAVEQGDDYYVYVQPVVEQVIKGLRKIEQGRALWSADLPGGERGTSIFDLVITSLFPHDLRAVEDTVTAGRRMRTETATRAQRNGSLFGQANYETLFASLTAQPDPERPLCPVIIVRLRAVRGGGRSIDTLIRKPQPHQLAGRRRRALPRRSIPAPGAEDVIAEDVIIDVPTVAQEVL